MSNDLQFTCQTNQESTVQVSLKQAIAKANELNSANSWSR
ncbi:hypothetical protein NIES37_04720 [Tolypothrix tenuis PCC 7101]|uniref:Uncharacterized protein n=1 Tax=Tolypothrix tenuis PCC 7101 TaxID=231146 RepID=A0A1Z4MSV3_9CYAN|nr:hypothetical protein NIES37_04720 [Tolypothrix tenuis PCC 7101]BAZ72954.1 hypothetical protein NIES50_15120 [Aulosira laxa NIES-50]